MKIKLAVIFGGKSVEHEISVISALQAIDYINEEKYEVFPVYITKDNLFYTGTPLLNIAEYKDIDNMLHKSMRVSLVNTGSKAVLQHFPPRKFSSSIYTEIDIALPIVHGTNVEDGTIQGLLKFWGIPFAGCSVTASSVCMDKYFTACVLKEAGIPVLPSFRFYASQYMKNSQSIISQAEEKISYPIIIKPVNLGSSVGIKIALNKEELKEAIEHALLFSDIIMAQKAITNLKEINISVLGDSSSCEVSECEEPIQSEEGEGILSYQDKYMRNSKSSKGATSSKSTGMASLSRKIPADISFNDRDKIRSLASLAFTTLSCSGVSRIDFIQDLDTGEIYFNEINTIPGSLSFYLWEKAGLSYPQLLDRIISLATKRERENSAINFSFSENILSSANISLSGSKSQ